MSLSYDVPVLRVLVCSHPCSRTVHVVAVQLQSLQLLVQTLELLLLLLQSLLGLLKPQLYLIQLNILLVFGLPESDQLLFSNLRSLDGDLQLYSLLAQLVLQTVSLVLRVLLLLFELLNNAVQVLNVVADLLDLAGLSFVVGYADLLSQVHNQEFLLLVFRLQLS